MSALPRQLGMFDKESKLFSDMKGKKFTLFPGSALAKRKNPPQWVLFFALVETSRVFARGNALIRPEWLEQVAPHICSVSYDNIHWDESSGFVYARERITAGQLLINPGRAAITQRCVPRKPGLYSYAKAWCPVSRICATHGWKNTIIC